MMYKSDVKQLRKELRDVGYKLKTEHFTPTKVFASIYLNDKFIYGTGANVYTQKTIDEHRIPIDVFNKYQLL